MIGSSTGEQYETDYDYTIGRPVGAATEPADALKPSGGTLDTPVDQKAIDELVAAAPNFANSPVIDQMSATAERSRPELPITGVAQRLEPIQAGGGSFDSAQFPEMVSNPRKFIKNEESWNAMVKSWEATKSTNIEDRTKDLEYDADLRVQASFADLPPASDRIDDLMTKPLDEVTRDLRMEAELKSLGKKRLREQRK